MIFVFSVFVLIAFIVEVTDVKFNQCRAKEKQCKLFHGNKSFTFCVDNDWICSKLKSQTSDWEIKHTQRSRESREDGNRRCQRYANGPMRD